MRAPRTMTRCRKLVATIRTWSTRTQPRKSELAASYTIWPTGCARKTRTNWPIIPSASRGVTTGWPSNWWHGRCRISEW